MVNNSDMNQADRLVKAKSQIENRHWTIRITSGVSEVSVSNCMFMGPSEASVS